MFCLSSHLPCHPFVPTCSTFSEDTPNFTFPQLLVCSPSQMPSSFSTWQPPSPLPFPLRAILSSFRKTYDLHSGSCPQEKCPVQHSRPSSQNFWFVPLNSVSFLHISISPAPGRWSHPGKVIGKCWLIESIHSSWGWNEEQTSYPFCFWRKTWVKNAPGWVCLWLWIQQMS